MISYAVFSKINVNWDVTIELVFIKHFQYLQLLTHLSDLFFTQLHGILCAHKYHP